MVEVTNLLTELTEESFPNMKTIVVESEMILLLEMGCSVTHC